MVKVIGVRFKESGKIYFFDPADFEVSKGDYVIVDKASTATNSQIVVALVGQESATVKRLFREDNHIRLQPENDFMEPIILDPSEVNIVGHVKGVFRVIK